jgi:hypothetical protein
VRTGPAPFYTSDPHGCAQQSLHHVLVPGWQAAGQRAGACPRRPAPRTRIWPGPGCHRPDGGHRMPAARPAGQAARVPSRRPAVTLTAIPPAARPRYAQAARAQSPPALALRLRQHGHEPQREAPVPIDDRVQPLITGRQRPMPGQWPPEASLLATARHPVLRARTPAVLHGRACCRRGGSRAHRLRPGAAAREPRPTRPDPDHRGRHSRGCWGCRPWQTRSCRAESGTAPPRMRWRGRARPRRVRPTSCLVFAARRPPGPGTRARGRSPGSSRVPGVAPG